MNTAGSFGLGLDTGGTYTDAVLLDLCTRAVVRTAKTPTTHHDLKLGVALAMQQVMAGSGVDPADVALAAVSTTLATNAVLEDTGDRVGCVAIGYPTPMDLPVLAQHYVTGGHLIGGREAEPLDVESLLEGVGVMRRSGAEAYAVCSVMSMENATHELVAAKAISLVAPGSPVFCSHECSSLPGFRERAATTVLNARLTSIMQRFADGVEQSMRELGIHCPVRILRGDAGELPLEQGPRHAVETVGSGPAATTWFGKAMGKVRDAVVVDVGGTSTDVTLVQDGLPVLMEQGQRIGKWDTHVRSLAMYTVAAGGDSLVQAKTAEDMQVGPRRVLPLCLAPELPPPADWIGPELAARMIFPGAGLHAVDRDDPLLEILHRMGPTSAETLRRELSISVLEMERRLDRYSRKQLVLESGFTPTDALHVLGRLELGDAATAAAGAKALAGKLGLSATELCGMVVRRIQKAVEDAVVRHLLNWEGAQGLGNLLDRCHGFRLLRMHFSLGVPLVGVGAAARTFLPAVADTLHTEIILPEHHAVGNALGALLLALEREDERTARD